IQAQLNNLEREIKKVNEKVYAAQVGCEQCKEAHYTKDYPLKEKVELADRTVKYPKGIAKNVLVVVENIDGYQDQDMGDIILGEPFYKATCVEARRVD
nr:hypothetical protein [Tanacetum cinerariifolium]